MRLPHRLFGINAADLTRLLDRLTQDGERDLAIVRQQLAALQSSTADLKQRRDSLDQETERLESEQARLLAQLIADRQHAEAIRTQRACAHGEELAVQEHSLAALQGCVQDYQRTYEYLLRSLAELVASAVLPDPPAFPPDSQV